MTLGSVAHNICRHLHLVNFCCLNKTICVCSQFLIEELIQNTALRWGIRVFISLLKLWCFFSPPLAEHTGLWNSRLLLSDSSYCLLCLHKSCLHHLRPTQKGPQWLLQQSLHQCAFSNKWWVLLFCFFKEKLLLLGSVVDSECWG